ncbi:MAG: transcriptional repressor NrdR, partial [Deltaproteobacteria bacterium]
MKCPFCGEMESRVIDSRLSKDGTAVRRRRECEACRKRYTTYERVENQVPMVVKKDGRREQFNRQKLLGGILKACQKRPVGIEEIERFCDELQSRIQETGEREV